MIGPCWLSILYRVVSPEHRMHLNIIKIICDKPTANIIPNGEKS